jgi:hypothetical protein
VSELEFGDHVRVLESPETRAAGLVGREGVIYGFTTPSVTSVDVVGGAPEDHALNVFFEAESTSIWIRPDLVEFLAFDAGAEMSIDGASVKWVRNAEGGWDEVPIEGARPVRRGFLARLWNRRP